MSNSTNAKIILINIADTLVTLTAIPEPAASLPVTYLQRDGRSYAMRSTSDVDQAIYGNLDVARNINTIDAEGFALFGEFSSAATCRLRLYSEQNQGGYLTYDSDVQDASPRGGQWFHFCGVALGEDGQPATGAMYQSFTLDFADPAAPNGYHTLYRLVVGKGRSSVINIDTDYTSGFDTTTTQTRAADGSIRSEPGAVFRKLRFRFGHLSESERRELEKGILWAEMMRDVFVALRPEYESKHSFAMLCKFTSLPDMTQPYFGRFSVPFELSESAGSTYVPAAPDPPVAGTDGEAAVTSEWWKMVVPGEGPVTEWQAIASDGAGKVVITYSANALLVSDNHGLSFLRIVIESCPSRLMDVRWSGTYFLACGDSGDIYHSVDGFTWTKEQQIAASQGLRFDIIVPFTDGFYLAAGEQVWLGLLGGSFSDVTSFLGWAVLSFPMAADAIRTGPNSAAVLPAYAGPRIFEFNGATWVSRMAGGIPSGDNWMRIYADWAGNWVALTTGNVLYISTDSGANFVELYIPRNGYVIQDAILVAGPSLVLALAGPGGDRFLEITKTGLPGSFASYPAQASVRSAQYSRWAWTGRRAVFTDAGRVWVSPGF